MRGSTYAWMLLLYASALAFPVWVKFACDSDVACGVVIHGEVQEGNCLLATCGSGLGVICRTLF